MDEVIGELLPLALGVAISPVPIIAVILMLLAPRAKVAAWSFLAGWVVGIVAVLAVVSVLVGPVDDGEGGPSAVSAWIRVGLGVVLVLLAAKQWASRPKAGEPTKLPAWMSALDRITPWKAGGLGALLSGLNPKNLVLCAGGGVAIGSSALPAGEAVIAGAAFVAIAAASVAAPVLGYTLAEKRMRDVLDELRDWLTDHNAAVMTVLLLTIGVTSIGKGIGGLS
ncbi:GAP family protein [Nocardioides sp. CER19]|uniref:GAP family protein n=1 Tax=Nocardioides sp. CER19 TaxID=3038538 RepID=UPI00244B5EB8|nr:GAP family protein [Nocardioides sp. CER19]MDH2416278.1 GAP family protein [Nocardioides sp. CER19]